LLIAIVCNYRTFQHRGVESYDVRFLKVSQGIPRRLLVPERHGYLHYLLDDLLARRRRYHYRVRQFQVDNQCP
jgi:hypothetical protein